MFVSTDTHTFTLTGQARPQSMARHRGRRPPADASPTAANRHPGMTTGPVDPTNHNRETSIMDRSHFTDDDSEDGANFDHASEPQLSVGDAQRRKTRLLSRQCATCIFRPGNPMHLDPGRLRDIVEQALNGRGYIICHDTLPHYRHPHAQPAICRGFHDRYTTPALQVIGRLWGFIEVAPPRPTTDSRESL